jgi:hypothetical protein
VIGVIAAIALVAGYLGVAAVVHLSPFSGKTVAHPSPSPANTVASTSSAPPSGTNGTSAHSSPQSNPPGNDQILLSKIPPNIQGTNNCSVIPSAFGSTAARHCTGFNGPATEMFYYLFPSSAALSSGYGKLLTYADFAKQAECTTNGKFVDFIPGCQSAFSNVSPTITGTISEYKNKVHGYPVIVTTDNGQDVIVAMVGTNGGDLLAYWRQMQWVVP